MTCISVRALCILVAIGIVVGVLAELVRSNNVSESYQSLQTFTIIGVPYDQLRPGRMTPDRVVALFPPQVPLSEFDAAVQQR